MSKSWKNKYDEIKASKAEIDPNDEIGLFYQLSEVDHLKVDTDEAWRKFTTKLLQTQRTNLFSTYLKIAASMVIILIASFTVYQLLTKDSSRIKYITASTSLDNKTIALPDGSIVTLASNSSINYPAEKFTGKKRKITFEGEGYFEIVKGDLPFSIKTIDATIEVLGTSFGLNTAEKNTGVYVEDGLVSLQTKSDSKKIRKGQYAIANSQNGKIKIGKTDPNALSWKTGNFDFSDTKLSDAFVYLKKYYKMEFITLNENLKNCKVTVKFKKQSLESVVEVLSTILNAESKIGKNQVKFSGIGC